MAESKHLARLERLEGAFVHVTDTLVLQSERIDMLREEMTGLRGEMRALREETRVAAAAVTDRLDRLIAITTKDRTMTIERLASIEARLTRLEERVGI